MRLAFKSKLAYTEPEELKPPEDSGIDTQKIKQSEEPNLVYYKEKYYANQNEILKIRRDLADIEVGAYSEPLSESLKREYTAILHDKLETLEAENEKFHEELKGKIVITDEYVLLDTLQNKKFPTNTFKPSLNPRLDKDSRFFAFVTLSTLVSLLIKGLIGG